MPKITKFLFAALLFIIATVSISAQMETKKIDGDGLKNLLPNAESRKPVLLNFWATWCGPCRAEFPELVKIDADYREKGLNFSLVSVDNSALINTAVPEFLQRYGATQPSYLLDYATRREITKAVRQIAPSFPDRYPLTLLFDTKGKLVYQKIGVINPKILRTQIDKVLIKK